MSERAETASFCVQTCLNTAPSGSASMSPSTLTVPSASRLLLMNDPSLRLASDALTVALWFSDPARSIRF